MSFEIITYGDPRADILLLQMVDDHDLEVIEKELSFIRDLSGGQDFCLKAVRVRSWNRDLSPWPAPAVFGNEDFGEGAAAVLGFLQEEVLPPVKPGGERADQKVYLGGYSLAGLFALWAGFQTDRFDGIAAASPSIWFPGFIEYMRDHEMGAEAVYLSLGDREERTRNPVMSRVGICIREAQDILAGGGTDCLLEWNKGNHFREPDLRTARAFAWLMKREREKKPAPEKISAAAAQTPCPREGADGATLRYYEEHAEEFAANTLHADMEELRSRFLDRIPAGGRILDFGCGTGRDTRAFLDLGYEADAADGSAALCRIASDLTGISVRCLDFRDYTAREGDRYDGIWACASLLHLTKRELYPVMRELGKALRPGGILYVSFKYGDFEGDRRGRYFTDFTPEGFRDYLKDLPEYRIGQQWVTGDVRPGRGEERWLNVILEKA